MDLRPYQAAGIDAVVRYIRNGGQSGLVVWPTGAGKSMLLAEAARWVAACGGRTLIATHVGELVEQNAAACARVLGSDEVGVYSAGRGRKEADRLVVIASVQSVFRNPMVLGRRQLVIVDEAHLVSHEADGMYAQTLAGLRALGPTQLLGLTATPYRLATGRLDQPWQNKPPLFERIIHEVGIRDLIADGYLCRPIAKATRSRLDAGGVSVKNGEFKPGELQDAADVEALNRAIVDEIIHAGQSRRSWLVFATGVRHAANMAAILNEQGILADAVDGDTPAAQRHAAITEFKSGQIRALVGCQIFTTGFDAPAVDLVALCRPTMSAGLHVQMLGRGTRLSPSTGKTDCLVHDFAGNVARHGPLDQIDGVVRDPGDRRVVAPVKTCPQCSSIVAAARRACPDCSHKFPLCPREAALAPAAISGRVLSDDAPTERERWLTVAGRKAIRHLKPGRPDTLRLVFQTKQHPFSVSAFLSFDSENATATRFAGEQWRRLVGHGPVPKSVADGLDLIRSEPAPLGILVRPKPSDPRWLEIVDARFRIRQRQSVAA